MRVILCTDGGEILESFWLHSNLATDDKASIAVRIHIEERYSTYDDERSYVIDALKLSMAADQS